MTNYYLPHGDGELLIWLSNFKTKITTLGPALGFAAGEITDIGNLCSSIIDSIEEVEAKKNEAQNAVTAKENLKKEQLPVLRNAIKRLKTFSDYTDAIGKELGVVGSESAVSHKPSLKAKAKANEVELSFTKKGLDGVNVYARAKGAAQWTFLARDTQSPYHDTRPLANEGVLETREYMCIGVVADEEVGEASDIVAVVFGG